MMHRAIIAPLPTPRTSHPTHTTIPTTHPPPHLTHTSYFKPSSIPPTLLHKYHCPLIFPHRLLFPFDLSPSIIILPSSAYSPIDYYCPGRLAFNFFRFSVPEVLPRLNIPAAFDDVSGTPPRPNPAPNPDPNTGGGCCCCCWGGWNCCP